MPTSESSVGASILSGCVVSKQPLGRDLPPTRLMLRREPDDQGQETRKTSQGRRPEHWAMGTGAGIDPQT
jgi:hypothetical protein